MDTRSTPPEPVNPVILPTSTPDQPGKAARWLACGILGVCLLQIQNPVFAADNDDSGVIIIEDDDAETLIIEEEPSPAADEADMLIIEEEPARAADVETAPATATAMPTETAAATTGDFDFGLDQARLEYGNLYQSRTGVDTSNYGHLAASATWKPAAAWEAQISGRLDWYKQTGKPDVDEVDADYGESFLRYGTDNYRITAGAQKVIWGRIDELPPTDRMSRVDVSRGFLDALPERRRAMPVIRFEGFRESYKLDAVWIPEFDEAFLPDEDNIWYPVNQTEGRILGIESNPVVQSFVSNGSITDEAPSGDGGFGLRLSNTGERADYALTVQHVRQSTPYFELDPTVRAAFLGGADPLTAIASTSAATFKARYPRTWVFGGDAGFEALDATWRFEAAWITDTPVTRTDLRFDTVDSANWAAGVQFHPGDSDIRVNLQIVGINLIDTPSILDRRENYNFNGSVYGEFGNNRWRSNTRFFIGLDEKDLYINPEITFIGWEPHEIYAAWHYFNGNDGTTTGFYEDNSLLTIGWRAKL